MLCFLKNQSEESVSADEKMYDEAIINIRKKIDLLETNEVKFDGEEEEYDGEVDEYEGEEGYKEKKKDVGTQCDPEMLFEDINAEEAIQNKELEIIELGKKYKKEKKATDLAQLIRDVRPILAMISKAKDDELIAVLFNLLLPTNTKSDLQSDNTPSSMMSTSNGSVEKMNKEIMVIL